MSKILYYRLNFLSILDLLVQKFKINSLDLTLLNPDDPSVVKASHRSFLSDLNNHSCLIKAKSHIVRFRKGMYGPNSLETIVQECFKLKGNCVPNIDYTVLACRHDDREVRME
jgi:hypothetical protein